MTRRGGEIVSRVNVSASCILNVSPSAFSVGAQLKRFSGRSAAGPAICVRMIAGDNLALHQMIARASAGQVLAVAVCPLLPAGYFGEVMAAACVQRNIAALVIDGTVRDVDELAESGFPVFARGVGLNDTTKLHAALQPEGSVDFPEGRVHDGDLIVADGSGVVVLPRANAALSLEQAGRKQRREREFLDRIRAGETTLSAMALHD